jgi:N-succinyldiaminopimelate aminotransferase
VGALRATGRHGLVARLQPYTTTVFAEMSQLAVATGSLNLGQGFPDTDGPEVVLTAAVDAIRAGDNQYPPGPGIPELRTAVAEHQADCYGLRVDPDTEVLVTAGATEAIAAALLALCEPGDEVVLFEPWYDSYAACVAMAGATARVVTLRPPDWTFAAEALEAAITDRTRLVLLNTPHNPTGKVFARHELEVVARLCRERDLLAVTDEVYEHLVYDGEHVPMATLPGMAERTLTVSSAGKSFSVTGWKIGWVSGPAPLVAAVRAVKQFLTYAGGTPFQRAVAAGLRAGPSAVAPTRLALQAQRDLLCDGLEKLGLAVYRPAATYFVTTDVGPLGQDDGWAFCRALPARCGVVAVPAEVFYTHPEEGRMLVRWAFCKRPEVLRDALGRLAGAR